MPLPIILGILAAAAVGAAIAANWDSIVEWLSDLVTKLKRAWDGVRESIPHSARVFGDLLVNGMVKIIHKLYYKKDGKFFLRATENEVDENDVPSDIRDALNEQEEKDITRPMERELGMEI